ncbi:hypothetical protein GCM10011339_15060 [Echinicola rosea]|uniref:Uncharacterized protein n=2 Tax=Echinicola rosea TaxID=1807691 RepID=A0ABQ1UV69_9BACT|nr:hypothetical protein GCM10011339_15060 [Echinicola rosea]
MPQQSEKPTLPPEASMAPDMSMFEEEGDEGARVMAISNWAYAAINVGVYSSILYSHLAVPVTAFKATIGTEAVFDEDAGLWVWEKAFDVEGKGTYDIRLTANVQDQNVNWMGYISGEGMVDNFVWFTGTSDMTGEAGYWELYESPESASVWLSNSWEYDKETGNGATTFTVEKEGDNLGSSITYRIDDTMEMDRNIVITNTDLDSEIYVDWSRSDKFGQVKSESHFESDTYFCWDASLQNTSCE